MSDKDKKTDRDVAREHWEYTNNVVLIMLQLTKYLYNEAMVHGMKHGRDEMTDLVKTISEADKKEFLRLMKECFKDE